MPTILEETFSAWIDSMPGSPKQLIVQGKAEVPTGGWTGSLRPASPQGTVPEVIILVASLQKPSGDVPQVVSEVPLRYEEKPPKHDYTQATIRFEKTEFTIKVGRTS